MPISKPSPPTNACSLDEQVLPFAEHCEVLRKGVALSLGNHRRASILIENAVRLERQAAQYRAQSAAIKAAGGPRCGVRVAPLARTLTRLESDRDRALADAELCLHQSPNDVLPGGSILPSP